MVSDDTVSIPSQVDTSRPLDDKREQNHRKKELACRVKMRELDVPDNDCSWANVAYEA
jgi:hypothetical protein